MHALRWAVAIGLAVAAMGCSSSSDEGACVDAHGAKVCAHAQGGSVTITASGLRPGSTLSVRAGEGAPRRYPIESSGSPGGAIGFLSSRTSGAPAVTVEATAADGTAVKAALPA